MPLAASTAARRQVAAPSVRSLACILAVHRPLHAFAGVPMLSGDGGPEADAQTLRECWTQHAAWTAALQQGAPEFSSDVCQ